MTLLRSLEPASAVRRIDADRDDLLAIEIAGEVTASDVETFYGLLEGAYALHDQIDVLVRATEFERARWDEISEETLHDGRLRAESHVRRCAAVGGPNWTTRARGIFLSGTDVELRYFAAEDEPAAWEWIGATPI